MNSHVISNRVFTRFLPVPPVKLRLAFLKMDNVIGTLLALLEINEKPKYFVKRQYVHISQVKYTNPSLK